MTEAETLVEIEEILQHLEAVSFVAHRDAQAARPAVEQLGPAAVRDWLEAVRTIFFHDREAGKAFLHNTPAAVQGCGSLYPWVEQALEFTRWVGSFKAVEGFMAQVGDVCRAWGEGGEREWYRLGAQWCERDLESGVAYFALPFTALGGSGSAAGLQEVMQPAETLYHERRLPLRMYLDGALRVRDVVGGAGVTGWARRGADILQAGRSRGEAYFRLESDESLSVLMESVPGYRTLPHGRLFQLLLAAWFGQPYPLEGVLWRPGDGRPMIETDGRSLFVPPVFADREEALLAVLHAAGHLAFGTYERAAVEALFVDAGMEHPPVDADQRITWRPLFTRYGGDMFRFQLLFDMCEDLRVDARIGRQVPGYVQRLLRLADGHEVPDEPAGTYYRLALESLRGAADAGASEPALQPLLDPNATIVDAFRIANELFDKLSLPAIGIEARTLAHLPARGLNTARPVYPRDDDAPEHSALSRPEQDSVLKKTDQKRQNRQVPKNSRGDPDFDIPPEDTSGTGGRVGVGIPQPARVSAVGIQRPVSREGRPYPEWDYREQRYLTDWAWVQEQALTERSPERAMEILARNASALKRLRRALQMQRPSRPAPQRRQPEGDELDIEATVQYVTEKRAGRSPRPWVYKRRREQQRDTAVLLLADLSTSIMAEARTGEGKVVDRLRAGLMLFADALQAVGDPYAICGFASKYHDNVYFYTIKGFHDPLTPDARAAMAAVSGRLASRMGAAIRHALTRFDKISASRRLLLILSDGRPADYDDGGDERYLHEDTRMAMKEAQDAGVHPFCVTLDSAGSEYLPSIFGPGHFMVLDNVDDLPARLPEIYLRLRR
ncbi:MAG: VWA domain-containing protein [Gammaproteobacteria bacterium]